MTYTPAWSIRITEIDDNPFQARADYGDIAELAAQIVAASAEFPDTSGLMQIPHARPVDAAGAPIPVAAYAGGQGGRVQLLYGHRRLRAFRHLAESGDRRYLYMPLRLVSATDDMMLDAVWGENRNRRDLTAVEEARLMRAALDALNINQSELAARWGLARPTIVNKLSLLSLPESVQQAVQIGRISERSAQALLPLLRLYDVVVANCKVAHIDPERFFSTNSYGLPHPDDALRYLTSTDNSASSSQIRDYVSRVLHEASGYLGETLANYPAQPAETIRQSQCAGCSRRWNDRCLDQACLDARLAQMVAPVAAQAAANLGLPFSADPDHFAQWRNDSHHLLEMWQTQSCPHLVVGWYIDHTAARPLRNLTRYISLGAELFADLSLGVAMGCTHAPNQSRQCQPDALAVAEARRQELMDTDPLEAMSSQWRLADDQVCSQLKARARVLALQQLHRWAEAGQNHLVTTLLWLKNREAPAATESEAVVQLFRRYWDNSAITSQQRSHIIRARCLELLAILDLDASHLEQGQTSADIAISQARSMCLAWAENKDFEYIRKRIARELSPLLDDARAALVGLGDQAGDMAVWLAMVAAEVQAELDRP